MRIAIVSGDDIVDDEYEQLCSALAARGHHVTAYARSRNRSAAEIRIQDDYRTVSTCAGPAAARGVEGLPYIGDWTAELDSLWSSDPPDVVHAIGWLGGLAAQLAARRQRLPTVQTFHGLAATMGPQLDHSNPERTSLEPLLARNATWVTGGSWAEVDVLARLRHGRTRLSVLSTGVDVERYSPVGPVLARNGLHRVLCVEPNPLPCNGFDAVIRTLPKLPGTELVVAETAAADRRHDGARAALRSLATDLGVQDRVRFLGTVVADELPPLLRSAEVVVCTARQAGRATTALQAMASGVAVVAVDIGALTDTVVDGVTGLVVSPNDPAGLVAALKALHAQPFHYESMGAAGRSRAVSRFTWDRIALDALNIYDQTISQHLPHNKLATTHGQSTSGEHRVAVR